MRRLVLSAKVLVAKSPFYPLAKRLQWAWRQWEWRYVGEALPPPPAVKQRVVRQYGKLFGIGVLVETGTYLGDMVRANKRRFKRIFSVELDDDLFERAYSKFKDDGHIRLFHGDSTQALREVLSELNQPAVFWLDAHYSGGLTAHGVKATPILEEMQLILNHPVGTHVVLIDDARDFSGSGDYPTIRALRSLVETLRPEWLFEVRDDIVRAHPRTSQSRWRGPRT